MVDEKKILPGGCKLLDNQQMFKIGVTKQAIKVACPLCGNKLDIFNINEINLRFLEERVKDKTIDETVTLARIVWNNFPKLRLDVDSRAVIDELLKNVQKQVNNTLTPIDMIVKNINPLTEKLSGLTQKLPENIKNEFVETNRQLATQLRTIQDVSSKAVDPVQKQIKDLTDTINQLINKPTSKGKVGENILSYCWQETFIKDKVEIKGGAGQPDVIITPFLNFNGIRYGQKIIVERKAGKQIYNGKHLDETIAHAKAEGARYAMLIYDSTLNLVSLEKPFYLTIDNEVVIAVGDIETGGWRTAREVFEVFQSLTLKKENIKEEFDITKIQRIVEEMQSINGQIESLRKHNNCAINNCEKVRDDIAKLEGTLTAYQQKLKNHLFHQRSSKIVNAL